ncbi:MAG: hypothetical protein ACJ76I_06165 [Gaiellaceae bacterium]
MRLLVIVFAAALSAFLLVHPGASASSPFAFRTPDAGAACRAEGPALVCTTLRATASVRLGRTAEIVHRLPWWDASTPVRRRWRHGSLSCRLAGQALLCSNGRTAIRFTGAGFAVAA